MLTYSTLVTYVFVNQHQNSRLISVVGKILINGMLPDPHARCQKIQEMSSTYHFVFVFISGKKFIELKTHHFKKLILREFFLED